MPENDETTEKDAPLNEQDVTREDKLDDQVAEGEGLEGDAGGEDNADEDDEG